MYATLLFDVEDLVTTESDDIAKWLAEILTEEGVRGTFLVVAEKARLLEERGRMDVIEALRRHDLGSHTDTHSIHPTVSEYLEDKDWDEGVEEAHRREMKGFKDLERIFGVDLKSLGRPGGSYGPQLVYVLGKLGKAYVYCPVKIPGYNIAWFCGTLTFGEWFGGFDQTYSNTKKFNEKLNQLSEYINENHRNGIDWVGIFCCHPTTVRALEFWDAVNLARGRNPPRNEWKRPRMKTEAEMETAKKNFRRLVRFLKENPLIELKTIEDLMKIYSFQAEEITRDEMVSIAKKILIEDEISINEHFSPAEILTALAEFILFYAQNKRLANKVKRRNVLGPIEMPMREPETCRLTWKSLMMLAERIVHQVQDKGVLPGNIECEGKKVGISSIYFAFAEAFLELIDSKVPSQIKLKPSDPYPNIAKEVEDEVRKTLSGWIIHKLDLNQEKIVKFTKLQTWTLKPAFETKK